MQLHKKIKKSFPKIKKLFTEKLFLKFLQTPFDDLEKFNAGLSTMIRLKILRPKCTLYRAFIKNGVADKDLMTMVLIKAFYLYAQDSSQLPAV